MTFKKFKIINGGDVGGWNKRAYDYLKKVGSFKERVFVIL